MSLTNNALTPPTVGANLKREYVVKLADLKAGGAFTTVDIILDRLSPGCVVNDNRIWHTQCVDGTSFSASTARLKLVTEAASPVSTSLGAGALGVWTDNPVGVLDGTSSITGITRVVGDKEEFTKLIMTVTSTGGNLSAATQGEIHATVDWSEV